MFNRTAKSTQRTGHYSLYDPKMMATNMMMMRNSSMDSPDGFNHSSCLSSQPDIPLREPLDFDMRLNRKMAKKIYLEEKLSKVQLNKQQREQQQLEALKGMVHQYAKKEQSFMNEKRDIADMQMHRML